MDPDKNINDDLLDDEEIVTDEVEEGHDPVNAEQKSVDSVDKAAKTGPRGKKRPADKSNQENGGKAYKPAKGIVRELYSKMSEMSQADLRKLHNLMMEEDFDVDSLTDDGEDILDDVTYDMSEDISDLVESEATLSEEFRDKAAVIMEMAVKTKLKAEIAALEESYNEQLEEGLNEAKSDMVEMIDSYLNYVVENWMKENEVAVGAGLRTEIAEDFMNKLKDLFTESYIEVPEEKVDLVDDLSEQVERLEAELNAHVDKQITMAEELEGYKRDAIVLELGEDLADTQLDKLARLSESVDFDDEDTFRDRVAVIKETYFTKSSTKTTTNVGITEDVDGDEDDTLEVTGQMANYVNALKKRQ